MPLSIEKGAATFLNGFFDDRLDVKVGNTELGFAARNVRLALVDVAAAKNPSENAQALNKLQAAKAVFKRLVSRAMDDESSPDAAFYARRVIDRELGKGTCATCERAQQERKLLVGDISSKLGDRLDRKAWFAKIDAKVARHELSASEGTAMKIAVGTSFTDADDLARAPLLSATPLLSSSSFIIIIIITKATLRDAFLHYYHYAVHDFENILHIHVLEAFLEMEIEITEEMSRHFEKAQERRREEKQAELRVQEEQRLLTHLQELARQNDVQVERAALRHDDEQKQVEAVSYVSAAASYESEAGALAASYASDNVAPTPSYANDNPAPVRDNGNRAAGEASEKRGAAGYFMGEAQKQRAVAGGR